MSTSPSPPPAYAVGQFADPRAELTRLAQQAELLALAEEEALTALGLPTAGRLLDIGCGPGFVARRLRRGRPDLQIIGFDRDPQVLARAGAEVGIKTVSGDASRLPFPDAHFDCVHVRLTLRHLADPVAAIGEARRVLRTGAPLIAIDSDDGALILDPIPEPPFERALAARQETFARRGADPFIGRSLARLFHGAGLGEIRLRALVVDSVTLGREVFAHIVLSPIAEAIEPDLLSAADMQAAQAAIRRWSQVENAFGMTTVVMLGGRKVGAG